MPKGPCVLKILRDCQLTMRSKFAIAQRFAIATPFSGHHFPWFFRHLSSQRRVHNVVKMAGVVKTLRHSHSLTRSVFSTAGPLGGVNTALGGAQVKVQPLNQAPVCRANSKGQTKWDKRASAKICGAVFRENLRLPNYAIIRRKICEKISNLRKKTAKNWLRLSLFSLSLFHSPRRYGLSG